MAGILALIILVTVGSVSYDVLFYEDRQDKWEKAHPGLRYQKDYRKYHKEKKS